MDESHNEGRSITVVSIIPSDYTLHTEVCRSRIQNTLRRHEMKKARDVGANRGKEMKRFRLQVHDANNLQQQ
jgi:hypothetical protein